MNYMSFIKSVLILSTIVFLGFTVPASADGGMGYGHQGWMHQGWASPGFDAWSNLSEEEFKKLYEERNVFFEETKKLRQRLYAKELDLRSILARENPDAQKAARLQKEISELEAQLDQKRLGHLIKMRKISPYAGRGFMGHHGMMGPGMMGYPMMGPGGGMGPGMMGSRGYGGGRNYRMEPGMMGPGYEMGPGMMSPGWRGRGMGPARREPGSGRQPLQERRQLEEKDVRSIVENYIRSMRNPNLELGKIKDAGNVFEAEIVTKDKSLVDKVLVDKNTGWMRSAY
ncbi:MAG: periplasmic heavy metal sensor [Desulfobacterales bacterium]|nr:periplasmic heavy metal sensor [Desulfobacterales bacterium]